MSEINYEINNNAWELDNEYFVGSFLNKKPVWKKSFKKIHQRIPVLKKMNNLERLYAIQKQPPKVFCYKRCCQKLCKFHRKTSRLEPVFNKIAGTQAYNFMKRKRQ